MGVTNHFEGQLCSSDNYYKLICIAKNFAEQNHWEYFEFQVDFKLLDRVKDEKNGIMKARLKGCQ